ncbi:50S ribosomal protein L6 [Lentimicrobium sp.]|jgi:large subunit ribosomal protein L6|uniref:50S ribosomal protein L6 n=1 Tax=Lentimicrobium sp. TaxID=2034841 RepID=UPI0025CE8605|nr:50S ribosomal protein L6 [Lentimicrobium sp.]MCO5255994.1 50S ribosomal protein L6 [Lentimicrobium sp.]MCO5262805.1 50S ribosomal protein L6 [Lentimicrobium sp.]HOP13915.1 50S ribosomal protein L6 [Lentimicrobium sp.]HPF64680.1 50S ribosomal protein L6 [Lentimicrobium sp.]HPJ61791.1 50S ribosomal protein L6 [Lentimicrobium sp.]
MSRIGKMPVVIPSGVQIEVSDTNLVTVKGKLGQLTQQIDPLVSVKVEDGHLVVGRVNESQDARAKHGLYRSLLANMVKGVSEGFTVVQELVGVGYKASSTGNVLELSLGYSHNIFFEMPAEVSVETLTERGKNPTITLKSFDKQLIGQVAAKIRSLRKPEPYKGKGIRFMGEVVKKKAGKSASDK